LYQISFPSKKSYPSLPLFNSAFINPPLRKFISSLVLAEFFSQEAVTTLSSQSLALFHTTVRELGVPLCLFV